MTEAASNAKAGIHDRGEVAGPLDRDAPLDTTLATGHRPETPASELIFVSAGVVTDVFSTERAMDVSILDTQDMWSIEFMLQTVEEAIKAGTAGLYRLV